MIAPEAYRRSAWRDGWFDPAHYLDQLLARGIGLPADGRSLFEHYASEGHRLGIDPCARFSLAAHRAAHPQLPAEADPLRDWLSSDRPDAADAADVTVRPLALYLPQFHPIPENDAAYGRGHTEWHGVARARPLYRGHAQPSLPSEFGFYDLRVPEVLDEQAALAAAHGVHALCFFHYWFAGRRVLDRPLRSLLAGDSQRPFLVCWANESWVRRDAGGEERVILGQSQSEADDYAMFVDLLEVLADPRYLRVAGRPLLLVTRCDRMVAPAQTFASWRALAAQAGLGGLYLAGLRAHPDDPPDWGLDALVDYPPHPFPAPELSIGSRAALAPVDGFAGSLRDYAAGVDRAVATPLPHVARPVVPGVMPSWDNTPRHGMHGTVFHGDTPALFAYWFADACERAARLPPPLPPLLCINAWNEWAEGACIEPGERHGRTYLRIVAALVRPGPVRRTLLALRDAIAALATATRPGCVLWLADAADTPSNRATLALLTALRARHALAMRVVLRSGGPLLDAFAAQAPSVVLDALHALPLDTADIDTLVAGRLASLGDALVWLDGAEPLSGIGALRRAGVASLVRLNALPADVAALREAGRVVVHDPTLRAQLIADGMLASGDVELLPDAPSAAAERLADRLLALSASGRARRERRRTVAPQRVADDLCVVIPSYQHAHYLEAALDSLLSQSWRPAEIRIIDDGSRDASPALLNGLKLARYGVRVRCRGNRGAHATLNQGIEETRRPLVAILNSDDRHHPLRYETLLPLLRAADGPQLLFSQVRFIDDQGGVITDPWYDEALRAWRDDPAPLWLALLSRNFFMTTSNLVARRDALQALGGFRALRYSHDVDLLLRACLSGLRVDCVPATLCDYRMHAHNTIREDRARLAVEDAYLAADALIRFRPRLDDDARARLLAALGAKRIAGQVARLMQAMRAAPIDYDARHSWRDARFAALLADFRDDGSEALAEQLRTLDDARGGARE